MKTWKHENSYQNSPSLSIAKLNFFLISALTAFHSLELSLQAPVHSLSSPLNFIYLNIFKNKNKKKRIPHGFLTLSKRTFLPFSSNSATSVIVYARLLTKFIKIELFFKIFYILPCPLIKPLLWIDSRTVGSAFKVKNTNKKLNNIKLEIEYIHQRCMQLLNFSCMLDI